MCKTWVLVECVSSLVVGSAAMGQPCAPEWQPLEPNPALKGIVGGFTAWDPDGLGPVTPKVIVSGTFQMSANINADCVAAYDLVTGEWSGFGYGPSLADVNAVATLPNGDFVIGGYLQYAGKVPASRVARWEYSTSQWKPLGQGVNEGVYALATMPDGGVIVGGRFTEAGGEAANAIARWDSASGEWSTLGSGLSQPPAPWGGWSAYLVALVTLPNGDVVAGGLFGVAGGVPANCIARWDGSIWSPLGPGLGPWVSSLSRLESGDLVAAGSFTSSGGQQILRIARWSDESQKWSALGSGILGTGNPDESISVTSLVQMPEGDVLAAVYRSIPWSTPEYYVQRWNDSTWSDFGPGLRGQSGTGITLQVIAQSELFVGGIFTTANGKPANGIARWGCPLVACYADCDASGSLDIDDVVCFQTLFALADPQTDCDANGSLNVDDFVCFQTTFAIGC